MIANDVDPAHRAKARRFDFLPLDPAVLGELKRSEPMKTARAEMTAIYRQVRRESPIMARLLYHHVRRASQQMQRLCDGPNQGSATGGCGLMELVGSPTTPPKPPSATNK